MGETSRFSDDVADDYRTAPYRRLWRWVLIQAAMEAQGDGLFGIPKKRHKQVIARAREWLTKDSEYLKAVCELAGMDYQKTLAGARRKYAK